MRTYRSYLFLGLLIVVALGVLTACAAPAPAPAPAAPATEAPAAAAPAEAPKTLVIARIFDIRTLDPERQYELTPPMIMHAVYENLVTFEGTDYTRVVPFLAKSWDISDDGLTYTFHLRDDVTFHSGNPLTAEDVKFSFERLRNLKDNPSWLMDVVGSIDVIDEHTVAITLTEPNAAFLSMLVSPNFAIVDSKTVQEHGGTSAEDADTTDAATDWLDQNSAGTGPYILKGWTRDVEVVLEKNPNYWREPAKLDKIIIKNVTDSATQRMMVGRGDIDVAQNLDIDAVEDYKAAGGKIVEGNTMDMVYLAMTTSAEISEPLSHKEVRQAVAYAIDYDGIINELMRGAAIRLPTIIPVGLLGTDPNLGYPHDPDKAKQLLADAGYGDGFTVKMVYPTRTFAGGLAAETLAAKIQDDLSKVGITLELEPREPVSHLADYRAGKLAMTISPWTPDFLDPHGWAIPFGVPGGSAAKRVHYENQEVGDLAIAAGKETDPDKRAEMYLEFQKKMLDDAPFIGLIQPKVLIAVGPDVEGYVFNPVWWVDLYGLSKK
ncbi:MAG: ABC transporter substrate-binding protein [Caldilineae bacterium]|nr:MAG: ABC transporter substrate-binding protein [Caldilineae bacterium]